MDNIWLIFIVVLVGVFVVLPIIAQVFLTRVDAGTIRLVSFFGRVAIYRGPGKAKEFPLLTTGTTIPSKAINIDIDINDQTADLDANGVPKPIKVRVLASAIVSVGDTDQTILTAANRFFSKPDMEQLSTLSDLLSSAGRRAVNLLNHDQLYSTRDANASAKPVAPAPGFNTLLPPEQETEEDDSLAIIIKQACSRELHDLGLVFNSLNIKEVQSEVAEARRRQSAVEAKANADIATAVQERRAREAQLGAQQAISDKERELEQTKANNAALVAQAEALKQDSLAVQRTSELKATQIAQASADAERVKIEAEARAQAEAVKIRTVAEAQADAIRKVNEAAAGGGMYLTLKQLELVPQIAPGIAEALSKARLVTFSGGGGDGAASETAGDITKVVQMMLAAQLVQGSMNSGDAVPVIPGPAAPAQPQQPRSPGRPVPPAPPA
jgi:flotillin